MPVPQHIDELLEQMHAGDETVMGYEPELDEKRYAVPDNLPRSQPAPFMVPSFKKVPTYLQQGGTCVGNATGAALTHSIFQWTGEVVVFDGEALNARVTHRYDTPTSFRPIMDDILKSGVAPLSDEGLYFIEGYANVDWHDREAVRNAISTPDQMCVFATQITRAFGSNPGNPLPPSPGEPGMGLHAMLLVGYTQEGVVIQNNWGSGFGVDGCCVLSWEYVDTHFVEIMAITQRVNIAERYVKTHQYDGPYETAIKRFDLPDRKRPATYLARSNGRIWITDPIQAKRYGVRLPATAVPDTDERWALPVIGPDAPKQFR